jgi:membrane protease YdiL (CAAX protease family)
VIAKKFSNNQNPLILPAKTTLLFFTSILLVYLVAGLFLQASLGLGGIFINQVFFLALPTALISEAKGLGLEEWPAWKVPHLREIIATILIMLLLSVLVSQLVSLQNAFWPLPEKVEIFYQKLITIKSWPDGLVRVFVLAMTPAVCEEILFRGLIQPSWVAKFGKGWGMVLTNLAFAFAHGNLWHFHFYFILGFSLSYLMEWRGCLWLPILGHFINNLWTLFSHGS